MGIWVGCPYLDAQPNIITYFHHDVEHQYTKTALLELILRKNNIGYCSLRHIEMIRVISVTIGITYYHRVDHAGPTGWADDGAYIL